MEPSKEKVEHTTALDGSARLLELLDIQWPIIQAPMAGTDTPALAAAVSNAGGPGSLGAGATNTDGIRKKIAAFREEKPKIVSFHFGVPAPERVRALRDAGIILLGSATNPDEAQAVADAGIHAVVAQGLKLAATGACSIQMCRIVVSGRSPSLGYSRGSSRFR